MPDSRGMYGCFHVPGAGDAIRNALLRCAESFSPSVEGGHDYAIADVRGLGSLMGTPRDIVMRMAAAMQTSGLQGNVAVASTAQAALAAARGIPGITSIEPGDEARALSRLPLSLLTPSEELAETLEAWGIRTFGDLSRLPEIGLAERLGQEGVQLHRMARGLSPGAIRTEQQPHVFESSVELDHSVDSLESLAFVLSRLLHEVCTDLVRHGLAASALHLRLALENRTEYVRSLRLPFASTDASTFLKLLQYDLAANPPAAAILRVALDAEPASQRRLQGGLFIPVAPEAQKLEVTLARLTAVVGEGNVGSPELLNTHRPDAFRVNRFVAKADAPLRQSGGGTAVATPPLAIRLFRPPLPADVAARDGVPAVVRARGIRGDVIGYAGPWRTSGDWWRTDTWMRDEWDIALDCGALYRIFREPDLRWFIGGNYD